MGDDFRASREALGDAIRARRQAAGYSSQEGFAAEVGIHRTYLGAVERGEKNISLQNLIRIANALRAPLSQLIRDMESRAKG